MKKLEEISLYEFEKKYKTYFKELLHHDYQEQDHNSRELIVLLYKLSDDLSYKLRPKALEIIASGKNIGESWEE